MKSIRAILLTLSATASLAVLPSCEMLVELLNDPEFMETVMNGGKQDSASSSDKYYDSEGFPVFGWDGENPVYGYDPNGNPIYDKTQLDDTSTVPDWPPLTDSTTSDSTTSDSTTSDSTTSDSTTTDSTTSDSTSGDGATSRPSYGTRPFGPGYRGKHWGRNSKRASSPPPFARHRSGSNLSRRPHHSGRPGYDVSPRRFDPRAGRPDYRRPEPGAGGHGASGKDRREMDRKKFRDFKPVPRSRAGKSEPGKDLKPGKHRGKSRDEDEKDKKRHRR